MDENIAKGYATQFFNWLDEDIKKTHVQNKKLIEKIKPFSNRKQFTKFSIEFQKIFENFSMNYFYGGSERNQFIAITSYEPTKEIYEDWLEKEIIPKTIFMHASRPGVIRRAPYAISEHAIKRIFQRSGLIDESNKLNHYLIIQELAFVPVWASFWFFFRVFTKTEDFDLEVYIPAKNGLFLCKMYQLKNITAVSIRTYLGPKELSEEQIVIKDFLINISKDLKSSMLSFFPASEEIYTRQVGTDFNIMLNRLKKDTKLFTRLFLDSNDELKQAIFNRKLNEEINNMNSLANFDELDSLLKQIGYKKFMNLSEEVRLKTSLGHDIDKINKKDLHKVKV